MKETNNRTNREKDENGKASTSRELGSCRVFRFRRQFRFNVLLARQPSYPKSADTGQIVEVDGNKHSLWFKRKNSHPEQFNTRPQISLPIRDYFTIAFSFVRGAAVVDE